jgi:tetratricopeptide (TPR) repeat protein
MKKSACLFLQLTIWVLAAALPAAAAVTNTVKGTLRDQKTDRPLAGARVVLTASRTQTQRVELTSDAAGAVYKNGMPTGSYEVQFEKEGYFPARTSIRLGIGDTIDISARLEPVPDAAAGGAGLLRSIVELVRAGKFAESMAKADAAVAGEPASAMLYYYRGFSREKTGDAAGAVTDYGKAVELKPDFALALASLGKLQARQGEYAKAAENYKRALGIADHDPDALYNYAVCLVNLGDNESSGKVLEKLLAADPGHADAWYQLGIVRLGLGDMAGARECLGKFLEIDPQHRDAAAARQILDSIK